MHSVYDESSYPTGVLNPLGPREHAWNTEAHNQGVGVRTSIASGERFGRWTVLSYNKRRHYLCRCDCGSERSVPTDNLRRGTSRSCGCYRLEVAIARGRALKKPKEALQEADRLRHKRYYRTEKFRAARSAYKASQRGQESLRKYYKSEKRKQADRRSRPGIKMRRRAAMAGQSVLSAKERSAIYLAWENRCAYCERDLTPETKSLDHLVAIASGGGDVIANVVPACRVCNKRKWRFQISKALDRMAIDRDAFWARVSRAEMHLRELDV